MSTTWVYNIRDSSWKVSWGAPPPRASRKGTEITFYSWLEWNSCVAVYSFFQSLAFTRTMILWGFWLLNSMSRACFLATLSFSAVECSQFFSYFGGNYLIAFCCYVGKIIVDDSLMSWCKCNNLKSDVVEEYFLMLRVLHDSCWKRWNEVSGSLTYTSDFPYSTSHVHSLHSQLRSRS